MLYNSTMFSVSHKWLCLILFCGKFCLFIKSVSRSISSYKVSVFNFTPHNFQRVAISNKTLNKQQCVKVHAGSNDAFGQQFKVGDIVGCFLDVWDMTISESLDEVPPSISCLDTLIQLPNIFEYKWWLAFIIFF